MGRETLLGLIERTGQLIALITAVSIEEWGSMRGEQGIEVEMHQRSSNNFSGIQFEGRQRSRFIAQYKGRWVILEPSKWGLLYRVEQCN